MMFEEKYGFGVLQPHYDPLVISTEITKCDVSWVFIHNDSSVNVVFLSVFDQLRSEIV